MSKEIDGLRSQIAALEQLLSVHERVALEQSQRLEQVLVERDGVLADIEAERSKLLDLLEKLPAAISMYEGRDLILSYINPRAKEILGERAEGTGRPLKDLFPEAADQGYLSLFQEVFSSGDPFLGTEAPLELDLGGTSQLLYFDFVLIPLKDRDGKVQGILSFSYEVTEKVGNRHELETLAGRLKNLAEASLAINAADTVEQVLKVVAAWSKELTEAADVVISVGTASFERAAVVLSDSEDKTRLRALRSSDPFGMDAVVADEKAAIHLDPDQLKNVPGREANSTLSLETDWIGTPLITHEADHMGSIQLTAPAGVAFDIHAAAIMTQLGQIASIAIENVRTYQREHRIAETLQRSLLPQSLPRMDNFILRSTYVAGADGVSVGGDWYDAIELDDGKIGLVLGDVVGKGIRAAVLMSQFRNALRVYAFELGSPARVLERLDRLMARIDPTSMATLIYGILDDETRSFTYANAGHLPPALLTGSGARYLNEAGSVPIGVDPSIERVEATITLEARSTLVFYTDGLVERRGEALDEGLQRMLDLLESVDPGDGLADRLVAGLLEDEAQQDDIAILTVSA